MDLIVDGMFWRGMCVGPDFCGAMLLFKACMYE